jgi:hypothetical protein
VELERSLERVRDSVRETMRDEGQRIENQAATSWPVGKEPGGLSLGHSNSLFGEVDIIETDDGIRFNVDNQAPYAEYINVKGAPGRLVWERDLLEPVEQALPDIAAAIDRDIMRKF